MGGHEGNATAGAWASPIDKDTNTTRWTLFLHLHVFGHELHFQASEAVDECAEKQCWFSTRACPNGSGGQGLLRTHCVCMSTAYVHTYEVCVYMYIHIYKLMYLLVYWCISLKHLYLPSHVPTRTNWLQSGSRRG